MCVSPACVCLSDVYICACEYVCVFVCMRMYVCVCLHFLCVCICVCVCVCAYVLVSKRTTRKLEKVVFADCLFPSRLIRRLSEGAWIASCRTMRPCLRIKKNDVISCECNGTVPIGQQRTRECEREREVIM